MGNFMSTASLDVSTTSSQNLPGIGESSLTIVGGISGIIGAFFRYRKMKNKKNNDGMERLFFGSRLFFSGTQLLDSIFTFGRYCGLAAIPLVVVPIWGLTIVLDAWELAANTGYYCYRAFRKKDLQYLLDDRLKKLAKSQKRLSELMFALSPEEAKKKKQLEASIPVLKVQSLALYFHLKDKNPNSAKFKKSVKKLQSCLERAKRQDPENREALVEELLRMQDKKFKNKGWRFGIRAFSALQVTVVVVVPFLIVLSVLTVSPALVLVLIVVGAIAITAKKADLFDILGYSYIAKKQKEQSLRPEVIADYNDRNIPIKLQKIAIMYQLNSEQRLKLNILEDYKDLRVKLLAKFSKKSKEKTSVFTKLKRFFTKSPLDQILNEAYQRKMDERILQETPEIKQKLAKASLSAKHRQKIIVEKCREDFNYRDFSLRRLIAGPEPAPSVSKPKIAKPSELTTPCYQGQNNDLQALLNNERSIIALKYPEKYRGKTGLLFVEKRPGKETAFKITLGDEDFFSHNDVNGIFAVKVLESLHKNAAENISNIQSEQKKSKALQALFLRWAAYRKVNPVVADEVNKPPSKPKKVNRVNTTNKAKKVKGLSKGGVSKTAAYFPQGGFYQQALLRAKSPKKSNIKLTPERKDYEANKRFLVPTSA